jgi:hypothetical protein
MRKMRMINSTKIAVVYLDHPVLPYATKPEKHQK